LLILQLEDVFITMASEHAIQVKRQHTSSAGDSSLVCIVHYDRCRDTELRHLSSEQFRSICNAVEIRQVQNVPGTRLDVICRSIPSEFDDSVHGCHRWCFKNFTNVSRLSVPTVSTERSATRVTRPMVHSMLMRFKHLGKLLIQ